MLWKLGPKIPKVLGTIKITGKLLEGTQFLCFRKKSPKIGLVDVKIERKSFFSEMGMLAVS